MSGMSHGLDLHKGKFEKMSTELCDVRDFDMCF